MKSHHLLLLITLTFIAVIAGMLSPSVISASGRIAGTGSLTTLSTADRISASPDIAIGPDGSINVLWVDKGAVKPADDHSAHAAQGQQHKGGQPGGHTHINYSNLYFARSTDGGRTFSAPLRVNQTDGGVWGFATSKPRIAVSKSGIIHVFYSGNRRDKSAARQAVDSMYTRSTDGGKTFEPVRALNSQGKGMDDGELDEAHCFGTMGVAPNGDVHAYWIDTRHMKSEADNGAVYGVLSRNEGKTFEKERLIFENEACPCCQLGLIFSPDGKLYFSMRQVSADGSRDSVVARLDDRGKSFSARVKTSDKSWTVKACPLKPTNLATDKQGRVFAVWFAGEAQPMGAHFAMSEDGGKTFSKPLALHPDVKLADHAQVTVGSDGSIHAVWDARVGEIKRVFLRSSTDHGKTFGAVTELDTPPGAADYPAIAAGKNGQLFIAWQQGGRIHLRAQSTLVAQNK